MEHSFHRRLNQMYRLRRGDVFAFSHALPLRFGLLSWWWCSCFGPKGQSDTPCLGVGQFSIISDLVHTGHMLS